jgi:manganese transport protein
MADVEQSRSLADVHASVDISQVSFWRRMFAFAGPAYLVSVGYMDPGNWATDLEGGARFGYRLLWVLVMSNAMAILLQTLSARLGIVHGRDLAQACRETYPRPLNVALWVLSEIAIAACDLAEVLGAAIALNLLFHIPLLIGVILTAADTLLLLWFQSFGIRAIEAFILSLITVMAACFCYRGLLGAPGGRRAVQRPGAAHRPQQPLSRRHHPRRHRDAAQHVSAFGAGADAQHRPHDAAKRAACRYNLIDSVVALNGAMLVNCAILVLAAAVFFKRGIVVTEIQQAHELLVPLLGAGMAGVLFAVALLCSGQSSTLTGTMAGQVVMEGFLNIRVRPWLRRLITRTLAVVPAALTIYFAGDKSTLGLLLLSQAILSMQLPFAIVPLIHFTSDRARMGAFANALWVRWLAWITAIVVIGLNSWLAYDSIGIGWMAPAPGAAWSGRPPSPFPSCSCSCCCG